MHRMMACRRSWRSGEGLRNCGEDKKGKIRENRKEVRLTMRSSISSLKRRVLCVDDDQATCDLITACMSGYDVVVADSVASGFLLAKTEYFDLYILDLQLAYGDGIELCQRLRAFDPNTPVIFCTGTSDESVRQKALQTGAQAYFVKPIDFTALRDEADSLMRKKELAGLAARMAEIQAIRDEVNERLVLVPFKLRKLELQSIKAQDRALKAKASQAFSDAGGTRADFERMWPDIYEQAMSSIDLHEA
jgi:DNA-binding response OmpR family regulator